MAEGRVVRATLPGAISGVAHELQTPIATVRGVTAALRRDDVDAETRDRLLDLLDDATGELSRLVGDLLDAGRLDAGRLQLAAGPVDAAAVARAVAESATAAYGAEIELDAPAGIPPVSADAGRLRQALANLVGNATRYSPPGSPVRIAVAAAADGVRISVSDAGAGIAPADLERIFEPFVRLQSGVAGTGLGLYLARELTRAQGGELTVESEPGRGSTFALSLRVALSDDAEGRTPA